MGSMIVVHLAFLVLVGAGIAPRTDLAAKPVADLIVDLGGHDRNRADAAQYELGRRGRDAVPALLSLVKDTRSRGRDRAVISLGIIKDPETVPFLAECLWDKDWHVRDRAAYSLSQIGGQQARDALVAFLKRCMDNRDTDYRINLTRAAEALKELPDPRAFPLLLELISSREWGAGHTRVYAAAALGKIRNPRASGPLALLLNPSVPYSASVDRVYLDAIASTKGRDALPGLLGHLEALTKRLRGYPLRETWGMRGAANRQMHHDHGMFRKTVTCLETICGVKSQGQTYEGELQFWQDYLHQHFSVMYLPALLDENVCATLLRRFDKEHDLDKIRIMRAFGEAMYRPALDTLCDHLNHQGERTTEEARSALAKFGEAATASVVGSLAGAKDNYIRSRRILFILELGDNGKLDALIPYLTNGSESDDVRSAACSVLAQFHYAEIIPHLIAILAEKHIRNTDLCLAGKEALEKFRESGVAAIVAGIEQTDNPDHRANLIWALMRPNAESAIPTLTKCLQDKKPDVRRHAITALQQVEGVNAAHKILPFLDNQATRGAALLALEKLARRSFNNDVKACREWWKMELQ